MSHQHPSASTSAAREWEKEASQLLNGMPPAIVLKGLEREELTLKNLKNFYMEEMERLQLEESLLLRQLEEMQQNPPTNTRHDADNESRQQQHMDASHSGLMDPDAQEEQLVMLLQDEMAQVQMEEQMQLEHQHQQQQDQDQHQLQHQHLSDEDN